MNTDYMDYTDSLLRPPLAPPTQEGKLPLWEAWMSTESMFCQAVVKCGYLTEEQMLRAAERYRLGKSRDGGVIFWQIDDQGRTRDGKIMFYREDCHRDKSRHPSWASARLKAYYGYNGELPVERCLFGLHLLATYPQPLPMMEGSGYPQGKNSADEHFTSPPKLGGVRGGLKERLFLRPDGSKRAELERRPPRPSDTPPNLGGETAIAVVEAEKTAVIMSEVYPQYVWMAAGGLSALSAEKFRPLRDHKVVLFPDTDPDGTTYACWKTIAEEASRSFLSPVYVSPLLERHATPEQKAAKIDIVDLLFNPKP